jgi:xanthine dehydrogenase YagR molybdenum-binding subunit
MSWSPSRIDPVELRLRNEAVTNPDQDGLPWSSKALDQCLRRGAELIGWEDRDPAPRSMREGDQLIGYGMAAVSFFYFQQPCTVRVVVRRDGTAAVHCAAMDIGTGTYTVVTQVAADRLGLELSEVEVVLGDSSLPASPPAGGSGLAMAITNATALAVSAVLGDLDLDAAPGRTAPNAASSSAGNVSEGATGTVSP